MDRQFDIGDSVLCIYTGIVGRVLKFYIPTSDIPSHNVEQTVILTADGYKHHAATTDLVKY
jgi:hypothetical protein